MSERANINYEAQKFSTVEHKGYPVPSEAAFDTVANLPESALEASKNCLVDLINKARKYIVG